MDYIALGRRIREERLKLNLTQERLAEDVELSTAYIGQIERGERSLTLKRLVSIVNRLGVTIDYLLSDSVSSGNETLKNIWCQLVGERSEAELLLAVNMIKMMYDYLDKNKTAIFNDGE